MALVLHWRTIATLRRKTNSALADFNLPSQFPPSILSATPSMPCTRIPFFFLQIAAQSWCACVCQGYSFVLECLALPSPPQKSSLSLKTHLKHHFFLETFPNPTVRNNLSVCPKQFLLQYSILAHLLINVFVCLCSHKTGDFLRRTMFYV